MKQVRIDVREPSISGASDAAGAFGVPIDGRLPIPAGSHATAPTRDDAAQSARPWWAQAVRVVRNAAIAVAVMALVPIGLVAIRGDDLARALYHTNMNLSYRVATIDPLRTFRLPSDPSITPMQAGIALNVLQPHRRETPGFTTIEPATRPTIPWQATQLSPGMFESARTAVYSGPSHLAVLEAVAKGFSPAERAYLRELATAPVWREFDLVARASAVDIVGGQFRVPFDVDALPEQRPMPSMRGTRELAYAAVSRAAHHMAIGQRDSAETVLRSIVSFGFALVDNSSSPLEEIIGAMIVGMGRDALQRFYVIHADPRANHPALGRPNRNPAMPTTRAGLSIRADEARRGLLSRVQDPAVPPGERFQGLQSVTTISCTNVRELLLGPGADVTDALRQGRHVIARYPSERALADLQTRMPASVPNERLGGPIQGLATSAATVVGVVTNNPRLVTCTRLLSGVWWGPQGI